MAQIRSPVVKMTAALPNRPLFVRRLNPDGSIDSVCRKCFMTAATAMRESDLQRSEREHICDPYWLRRFQLLSPEASEK